MTRVLLLIASGLLATVAAGSAAQVRWGAEVLRQEPEWYASAEARAIADSVLQYQSPQGAWPKNTNLAVVPRSAAASARW